MKRVARGDGGRVNYTEAGEAIYEKRGRRGGNRKKQPATGRVTVQRRTSARNASRRGLHLNPDGMKMEDLKHRYVNRRNLVFKANCPTKAPNARASIRYLDHVWRNKMRYTVGDIIAVTDKEDNLPYFAQIRGLMVNPMMDAFAALTWLVPKKSALEPHVFVAEHFGHGLMDTANYSLEICTWISSRPSLPAYRAEWTTLKIAQSGIRDRLQSNWRQLHKIAKAELSRINQKPLLNMLESINDECKPTRYSHLWLQ